MRDNLCSVGLCQGHGMYGSSYDLQPEGEGCGIGISHDHLPSLGVCSRADASTSILFIWQDECMRGSGVR